MRLTQITGLLIKNVNESKTDLCIDFFFLRQKLKCNLSM